MRNAYKVDGLVKVTLGLSERMKVYRAVDSMRKTSLCQQGNENIIVPKLWVLT